MSRIYNYASDITHRVRSHEADVKFLKDKIEREEENVFVIIYICR